VFEKIRKKLNENPSLGIGIGIAFAVVAGVAAFFAIRGAAGPSDAARHAAERPFMDPETNKVFFHERKAGEKIPIHSPYSGKDNAYPADQCWWTKDGKIRQEPFYLLRNNWLKKSGPTFCPDCGRFFDPNLGMPAAGMNPPPTREEWAKTHGKNSESSGDVQ
jgi:hypothetical protein